MSQLATKITNQYAKDSYVIFASDESQEETLALLKYLNISHRRLLGCYTMKDTGEKVIEPSYIINANRLEHLKSLGIIDNQESILLLGAQDADKRAMRSASLVFMDDSVSPIGLGYMKTISEEEALTSDNWTYDIANNRYFVAE